MSMGFNNDPNESQNNDKSLTIPSFICTGTSIAAATLSFDSHMRITHYINPLEKEAARIAKKLLANPSSWMLDVILHNAVNLRNNLLSITRSNISSGSLAMSEYLKESPPSLTKLKSLKAKKLGLSVSDPKVSKAVISSAFKGNASVNRNARNMRFVGITLVLGMMAARWYTYRANSEETVYSAFKRSASEAIGGYLGIKYGVPALWGLLRYALPGMSRSKATILHLVFMMAASTAGTALGSKAYDSFNNH